MYRVNFGMWSGVFAVPNEVVDHHLKLCGPVGLQVLLLVLRNGRPMEAEELASELGQTLRDVEDALQYWLQTGVMVHGEQTQWAAPTAPVVATPQTTEGAADVSQQSPVPQATQSIEAQEIEKSKAIKEEAKEPQDATQQKVVVDRFSRVTRQDILEISQRDETIGHLIQASQDVLGKVLSNRETETIVALYYNYGLGPDVIVMLLQYCASIGKDNIRYIETLAVDWVNRDINTHERAEKELLRLTTEDEVRKEIGKLFHITHRGITNKEVEYYNSWVGELKMSQQMIEYANERTLENHGKVNFAYTNAILVDWHRKGIVSIEQAVREQPPSKQQKSSDKSSGGSGSASYDLDEVEKMLDYGSVWD